LKDIDVAVHEGEFTIILGRNGSGKSSLLKIMAGLLKPECGTLEVMGLDSSRLSMAQRARIVGYLPQFHRPVFPFAVEDVVLTGRASHVRLVPGASDRAATLAALERVGIAPLRNRPFTELSGGEQQLVMIARVLAQEPKAILLDEPTAHLDFVNQGRVLGLVKELTRSGLAVVAVLHDPNIAFLYGDRFVYLRDGTREVWDDSQQAWHPALLERVYGTSVQCIPYRNRALVIPRFDND
jgi:iron complex transport system ATP-binding protein